MKYFCLLTLTMSVGSIAGAGGDTREVFDRIAARAKTLNDLANPPIQKFEVVHAEALTPSAKIFLDFFQSQVWPTFSRLNLLGFQSALLHTAGDRALYNDKAESEEWMRQKDAVAKEIQSISTNKAWQETQRQWSSLSQGLTGEMAEYARRTWKDVELAEFSEAELPLLHRLTEIETKISVIANESKFVAGLSKNIKASNDIIQDYFAKKTTFNEAWPKLEALVSTGPNARAQDVALQGSALFQEAAIIRSKLAASKGYKSWADYRIAVQARYHQAPFDTVEGLTKFLQKILDDTLPIYNEFLAKQYASIPGADFTQRRGSQGSLIAVESSSLIREYFPKENIEKVWAQTMIENGFAPNKVNSVTLDGYPREKKYTHAYMNNASGHRPKVLQIDGQTLNSLNQSDSGASADWFNAIIYIVQNFQDDGPAAWSTAWHEGGHAMDYSHREDLFDFESAYGYTETHSMTMERFFDDVEFLTSVGKTREGKPLPRDIAEKYIVNSRVNSLRDFRYQVTNALYDIMLWQEPFTSGGRDFVTYARDLRLKLVEEATQLKSTTIEGIDPGYGGFATTHFYSGNNRYFGYILANVAAQMSAEKLWDTFEKTTGRRSLYHQPEMAKLLNEGYYKNGFLTAFPGSIEKFTGATYSPELLVRSAVEAVSNYKPEGHPTDCAQDLSDL